MMNTFKKFPNAFTLFVLIPLCLWSALSFGRIISNTLKPSGATDFHSYWYYGHFVRQGSDPYKAFFEKREPQIPVQYLDGKTISALPIAQPGLAAVPANTAPIILALTPFSFVSWSTAKILWMVCNLLLMLVIPWMAIQLWPDDTSTRIDRKSLLVAFSFWALLATRNAAGNGQTTLLVFALMLLALIIIDKHWIISGLVLGLALSKYSLSLPVLLFLLFKKKYKVVALSLVIQLIGLIGLSYLSSTSPLHILNEYVDMLKFHAGQEGIHLASLISDANSLSIPFVLTFTLMVGIPIVHWVRSYYLSLSLFDRRVGEIHILNILILWIILVVYHREYDAVVWILFITLLIYGVDRNLWHISERVKNGLLLFIALSVIWMSRPGAVTIPFLPAGWAQLWMQVSQGIATIILGLSLVLTIILLYRISFQCRPTRRFG